MDETLTVSCSTCVMRGSHHCNDCVVTFLCEREPGDAVVIDAAEERAVRMLSRAGLIPELRHVRRAG